jgi:hypothetical protein
MPTKNFTQARRSQPPSIDPHFVPQEDSSLAIVTPASTSATTKVQEVVRVPWTHDEVADVTLQDKECSQKLLTPGRELRDLSGAVDKLLINREDLIASQFVTGQPRPRSRRLVLSIEAAQLPLEDERAAAHGYAALVAREEALAAVSRVASRREVEALAAAAAAEAETAALRRDVARLYDAAEAMRVQRFAPFLSEY